MATFFRSSKLWVLDYTYDGRARRWVKALPEQADAFAVLAAQLEDLYGKRGRVVGLRPATDEEETQYLRGTLPGNVLCPTGRAPVRT